MFGKVIIAILLLGANGLVHADWIETISQTGSQALTQTDWGGPSSTPAVTFTVNQYDPAANGGIPLNSLHISLDGNAVSGPGSVSCIVPDGNGGCNGSLSSTVTLLLSLGATNLAIVHPFTQFNYSGLTPAASPLAVPTDSGSDAIALAYAIDCTGISNCTVESGAFFSPWIGNGTVTVNMSADGTVSTTNTSGSAFGNNPLSAGGNYAVSYDYADPNNSVPEPATLSLLALGLSVIAASRRNPK